MRGSRKWLCYGLFAVLASLWLGAPTAQAQSPAGKTYAVTVQSSFGSAFDDCYTFNADGTFDMEGLAVVTGVWTTIAPFDPLFHLVYAIAVTDTGFTVQWIGLVGVLDARMFMGYGFNSNTPPDTFDAVGFEGPCMLGPAAPDYGRLTK